MYLLEEKETTITSIANQQLKNLRAESECLAGRLFEESSTYFLHNK